jgi:hypothetical protein
MVLHFDRDPFAVCFVRMFSHGSENAPLVEQNPLEDAEPPLGYTDYRPDG